MKIRKYFGNSATNIDVNNACRLLYYKYFVFRLFHKHLIINDDTKSINLVYWYIKDFEKFVYLIFGVTPLETIDFKNILRESKFEIDLDNTICLIDGDNRNYDYFDIRKELEYNIHELTEFFDDRTSKVFTIYMEKYKFTKI
jgi:hypothetical protein